MLTRALIEKLRQEREARGFTQAQVGTAIGLSRQAIAAAENGATAPALDTLFRWAQFLGLRLEWRLVPDDQDGAAVSWAKPAALLRPTEPETLEADLAAQVTALAGGYPKAPPRVRAAVRSILALLADSSSE